MSHITTGKTRVMSLDDARAAAESLGGELVIGKTNYRWYGQRVGWTEAQKRETPNPGRCEHAIVVKGAGPATYEVGLVRHPDGKGWVMKYDTFLGGYGLESAFGKDCAELKTAIGVRAVTRAYRGRRVEVTKRGGKTRVRVYR